MAEKKQTGFIKLQIPAGAANPAPPVGPALGAQGVNIMQFCQAFNAQTQDQSGTIIPVEITVYEDKSFTFVCKTPPAAILIKEKLASTAVPACRTCSPWARSRRISSARSPRSRCRTSMPTPSRPPWRSSPARLAAWACASKAAT